MEHGADAPRARTKLSPEEREEKERKEYEEALQRYREWLDQHPFGNEPFKKIRVPRIRKD